MLLSLQRLVPLNQEIRRSQTVSRLSHCASTVRVLFDVMHMWAECLDSTVVWLPEPAVPAGWG